MKHLVFVVLSLLLLLPNPASAQRTTDIPSNDPLLGTWPLTVSKSKYKPGPAPKSQTRIYERHPFGIRATVKTVYADGRSTTVQSIYDYDKQEHPVTGSEDVDAIAVKRVTLHTHEATFLHAGREIGSFRREISKDGAQMVVTTVRKGATPMDNVEVYEKVSGGQ